MSLSDIWPLFGLRVRTPTVELRYPNDEELAILAHRSAHEGVHDPSVMPFVVEWTDVPPPQQQRNTMQFYWHVRGNWRPDDWTCGFVVVVDGAIIGSQGVGAKDFAILRTGATGSYLVQSYQGKGVGKEMRAAILHFLFAGLGAEFAETAAFTDNEASLGVTRALGYTFEGRRNVVSRGTSREQLAFRMDRATWEQRRRDDIDIIGLEPCLELFGASRA